MSKKVTNISDAKALKQLGAPLNMSVEQRTFSLEYSKRWFEMLKRNRRLLVRLIEYQNDASAKRQRRVVRAAEELIKAIEYFRVTPPVGQESQIIESFLQVNVARFTANWAAMESGQPMQLSDLMLVEDLIR
jgi:hypothetical protein